MFVLLQAYDNGSGGHSSPGAITGIVIGAGAFITLFVILCWWCHHHWKQRQIKKTDKQIQQQTEQQQDIEKQLQHKQQQSQQTQPPTAVDLTSVQVAGADGKPSTDLSAPVRFHPYLARIKSAEKSHRSPSHSRTSEMSFSGSVRNSRRFLNRGPSMTVIGTQTQTQHNTEANTPMESPEQTERNTAGEAPQQLQI